MMSRFDYCISNFSISVHIWIMELDPCDFHWSRNKSMVTIMMLLRLLIWFTSENMCQRKQCFGHQSCCLDYKHLNLTLYEIFHQISMIWIFNNNARIHIGQVTGMHQLWNMSFWSSSKILILVMLKQIPTRRKL